MPGVLLEPPEQRWACPNCDLEDVTHLALEPGEVAQRFHSCRGLRGITVPMIPAGVRASVVARDREDYVGREMVQTDGEGRPLMSVITTRDDGQDCTVYAPCATANLEELR